MTETITLIEAEPGRVLVKTYADPTKPPRDYDAGFLFRPTTEPIADLGELRVLLEAMTGEPRFAIVRGEPEPDALGQWVPKRSIDRDDADAAFRSAPRRWLAIDVDDSVEPMPAAAAGTTYLAELLEDAVERWRATLPDGLRQADLVWQWSAKAHLSPTVRGRAWFWLAEPAADAPLRAWANRHGFDAALYRPTQPHYTAAPVFEAGADPLLGLRVQWHPGTERLARLDLDPGLADSDGLSGAMRVAHVRRVGAEGSDRYAEARAAILESLGDPADHEGQRFWLCGHLGGMLAKMGWPQADTEALIAEWLDVGDPRIDVAHGVEWAIQAYGLDDPATATGKGDLAGLEGVDADAIEALAVRPTLSKRRREAIDAGFDRPQRPPKSKFDARVPASKVGPPDKPDNGSGVQASSDPDPLASIGTIVDRTRPTPALDWRVADVFAPGKVSLLLGPPAAGKGPLALWTALSIAAGASVFPGRWGVVQCPVVYFDSETGSLAEERDARMCRALDVDRASVPLTFVHGEASFSEDMLIALDAGVRARGAKFLVIDTYGSTLPGDTDHNAAEFSQWLKLLARIGDGDVTVLVLMHAKKGASDAELEMVAGHYSAAGAAQTVIRLVPRAKGEIEVRCARHPRHAWAPFRFRWVDVAAPETKRFAPTPGGASWGLRPELVDAPAEETEAPARPERGPNRTNLERASDAARAQLDAGRRIWGALLAAPAAMARAELVALSGESARAAKRALALLVEAGLAELRAGHYTRAAGASPNAARLKVVLAGVAGSPDPATATTELDH